MRRGGLLGDPIWVRSCYFLPRLKIFCSKIEYFIFVELKYLWELPLSSSPVVCEANFPMGFANCRNNCQGTAILHSLHLLKKSYKEYREYPHICHFCYKVSRKYYVSFLCVIYGGKKISLAFIILYSLWKGAQAIKLPHCSEPLFSVFRCASIS